MPVKGDLASNVLLFARELRGAGVAVSAAEVRDALEMLRNVPLERRETVRAGLAATLLKDPTRRRTFDRFFDVYFPLRRSRPGRGGSDAGGNGEGEAGAEDITEALRDMDAEKLRDLARQRVEKYGDVRPEANVGEESYVYRSMRGLNLDAILSRLQEDAVEGEGKTALQRKIIREDLEERMERFRAMLHDEIFSTLLEKAGADSILGRERRPPPEDIDFLWARESDLEAMRAALAPLARKLAALLSLKRRRAYHGRLDMRRTIRRSLSTGGHFVDPRFRRPSAGKPEIVLLCDISGSMRAFAKFTLELTYSMATQFQRVRSFVFVDAVDEVTRLFEASSDFPHALERVDAEANVIFLDGQSWYGNVLEQFWRRAGKELTPKTTLIVVGDARNNFRTSGADVLHRIHERVRRLYWLNPEPRSHWNSGDSVMREFAPACDAVFEVRTLRLLERFVAEAL